jgi:hypothetical protein
LNGQQGKELINGRSWPDGVVEEEEHAAHCYPRNTPPFDRERP